MWFEPNCFVSYCCYNFFFFLRLRRLNEIFWSKRFPNSFQKSQTHSETSMNIFYPYEYAERIGPFPIVTKLRITRKLFNVRGTNRVEVGFRFNGDPISSALYFRTINRLYIMQSSLRVFAKRIRNHDWALQARIFNKLAPRYVFLHFWKPGCRD